jgi:hypothetical protein
MHLSPPAGWDFYKPDWRTSDFMGEDASSSRGKGRAKLGAADLCRPAAQPNYT